MRRIRLSVGAIIFVCLTALSIGLIALNVVNFTKLREYESTYSLSNQGLVNEAQQQTINALSQEVITLKEQLSAMDTDTQNLLLDDMNHFMTLYFLVDHSHPADGRLEAVKPYITDSLFHNISLKFQDDRIEEPSQYQSSIQIHDTYIMPMSQNNTNIKVLLYGTVTVDTAWGKTSNNMMISIRATYDDTQGKWLADAVSAADQVIFDAM